MQDYGREPGAQKEAEQSCSPSRSFWCPTFDLEARLQWLTAESRGRSKNTPKQENHPICPSQRPNACRFIIRFYGFPGFEDGELMAILLRIVAVQGDAELQKLKREKVELKQQLDEAIRPLLPSKP